MPGAKRVRFNKMFVLAEMKDTVRVKPWHFGVDLREAIATKLNKKLANKVSGCKKSKRAWKVTANGQLSTDCKFVGCR